MIGSRKASGGVPGANVSFNRHKDVTLFVLFQGAAWHRRGPQQGPLWVALGAQQLSAPGKYDEVLGNCLLQPVFLEVHDNRG